MKLSKEGKWRDGVSDIQVKGTLGVSLVYDNGVPKLNRSNQYQLVLEFTSDEGNKLMTLRGSRIDGGFECLLPATSGDRNQFVISRYTPLFQDFVLKWARKLLLEGDEKWTVQAIRDKMRGR